MSVEKRTGPFANTPYSRKYPWTGACDKPGCYYSIAGPTESDVAAKVAPGGHQCPLKGPTHVTTDEESAARTEEARHRPKNFYEKIWDELDLTVGLLKNKDDLTEDQAALERRYAEGLSFALAAIGQYGLTTLKEVRIEANKRWKMRVGEMPWFPTQGYTWGTKDDTPAVEHPNNAFWLEQQERARKEAAEARAAAEAATPTRTTPRASARAQRAGAGPRKRVFADHEVSAIKAARGMDFGDEELATMYGCTVEEIKSVV